MIEIFLNNFVSQKRDVGDNERVYMEECWWGTKSSERGHFATSGWQSALPEGVEYFYNTSCTHVTCMMMIVGM